MSDGSRSCFRFLNPFQMVATDRFDRVQAEGWGQGAQAAGYTLQGPPADFKVDGDSASITLPRAGASRGAVIDGVTALDLDATFRVETEDRPTGTALFVYVAARQGMGTAYRPKLLLGPEGSVSVHAGLLVAGVETPIGSPVRVTGLRHAPGVSRGSARRSSGPRRRRSQQYPGVARRTS